LRFWGFEADGRWTNASIVAACMFGIAVLMQVFALYRSLRIEDDEPHEYRTTVLWFVASAIVLLIGLSVAVLSFAVD
jgi:hypothetical protein